MDTIIPLGIDDTFPKMYNALMLARVECGILPSSRKIHCAKNYVLDRLFLGGTGGGAKTDGAASRAAPTDSISLRVP